MASKLPSGFKDLYSAQNRINTSVNLMGVVTEVKAPCKTRGTDWMCSFSISDPSCDDEPEKGLLVRFFRAMETELPKIQGTGDVVILRDINIKEWSGSLMAMSGHKTSWAVFASDSIPEKAPPRFQLAFVQGPRAPVPMSIEMEYAIFLCNSRDRTTFQKISEPYPASADVLPPQSDSSIQASTPRLSRDRFSLIQDVQVNSYYDLVGEVVKIYSSGDKVELYITDYTSNPQLYHYQWGYSAAPDDSSREGDEFGYTPRGSANGKWPGPFGCLTLTLTLWPDHSFFARDNVKPKDFVYLRNVFIRQSKDQKKFEGSMHTETKYSGKVNISILKNDGDDDRVKNIIRRKKIYSQKFKDQSQRFIGEARGQKRKLGDGGIQLTKAQARKQKRQQKEQALRPKSKEQSIAGSEENNTENVIIKPNSSNQHLNKHVRCSHSSIPTRQLSSILSLETHGLTTPEGTSFTLPFQNINSRATVRVVDFFPADIADFAVPCPRSSDYDALSDYEASDALDSEGFSQVDENRRWEWRFALVLEDAKGSRHEGKTKMKVYVADQDAEFLLQLDAEDLRASPHTLTLLREKLFVLWGDLEEIKRQNKSTETLEPNRNPTPAPHPKSLPFECCLKEYGIRKTRNRIRARSASVDDEGDDNDEEEEAQPGSDENFGWERRWRLWGTTII